MDVTLDMQAILKVGLTNSDRATRATENLPAIEDLRVLFVVSGVPAPPPPPPIGGPRRPKPSAADSPSSQSCDTNPPPNKRKDLPSGGADCGEMAGILTKALEEALEARKKVIQQSGECG